MFEFKMKHYTSPSFLILLMLSPAFAVIDFCRNHTFDEPTNTEFLHFSKENSDREFGIYDKFKCLHCCSHGYRSIEWFKNGQPYPWPTDVSTLMIHPESGNQTVCSQQSTALDSGRYWCIARNETHDLRHDVLLQISGPSISMGWPKTTYRPRDQKAEAGDPVRFYCEAFVGTIDLPDFQSEITWERYDLNQSFIDGMRVFEEAVFREEKRILGSYLHFRHITPADYGEYTCKVRNLDDQVVKLSAWLYKKEEVPRRLKHKEEQVWVFFFLVYLLTVIGSASSICLLRFGYLQFVRSRSPRFTDDPRKDVLVIYHKSDEQETLKAMTGLRGRYFSSHSLYPLQSKSQLGKEDLKSRSISHKAILALVSHNSVAGVWTCEGVHEYIEALLKLHLTVFCIFLQDLPKSRTDSSEWQLLSDSLSEVQCLDKDDGFDLKFWTRIRRKLSSRNKNSLLLGNSQTLI